ncbi:MAG: uncharacterized protein PWP08_1028 [Methanofollis sp.]|nr:uncharacterized protein [Methanofollis sp.]
MHAAKKGLRVLGVAESFRGRDRSVLAGVVMRRDRVIDGVGVGEATVGGMDATEAVIALYRGLRRRDVNLIMLSGCIVAWYNVIDPAEVHAATGVPVVVATYEDSEGLEEKIAALFPGDDLRVAAYRRLGNRLPLRLKNGYTVYIRAVGIDQDTAGRVVDAFTLEGKVPEPLRVARLAARAVMRYGCRPR